MGDALTRCLALRQTVRVAAELTALAEPHDLAPARTAHQQHLDSDGELPLPARPRRSQGPPHHPRRTVLLTSSRRAVRALMILLVRPAHLTEASLVIDLCGDAGATARPILDVVAARAQVASVGNAAARNSPRRPVSSSQARAPSNSPRPTE
ncbi:hypothetical protein [Streptomyces alanosinicus]|uniref:Uncharacterized protein n=1 Tax=Streptomyces alanosinicus TaxID=68171 RepID=A0A918YSZ3_9ACTN|nr:hypothetical protein [Streptomyces alanosinicus]GHE15422.1 hypothetical protein GCM10010339_90060 [Streptomyces alanosinicus]